MRTTLTLDDDVASRLQLEARSSGRPFRTVVNEYLRSALAHREATVLAAPFSVTPFRMGTPAVGRSYDSISGLLEEIEGPEHP